MNPQDTRMGLTQLVAEQNMSSVTMISEQLGIDEDTTRAYLHQLVETGELKGYITEDGSRFFKSEVHLTSAPVIASHEDWIPESHDTKSGKIIFVLGLALIMAGQAVPRLLINDPFSIGVGAALAMIGFVTLLGGLASIGCKG